MDIQVSDRVTYKNCDGKIITTLIINIDDIEAMRRISKRIEILKIERPQYEVIEEKKELLTEEEKEFLRQFIKFANYIPSRISKNRKVNQILFYTDDRLRSSYEFFEAFEKLEDKKIYTLKELGLE